LTPGIESLANYHKPLLITGSQKRWREWIVRGPHGVETATSQQPYLAILSPIEGRGTEQTVIVMNAAAAQLDGLSVEPHPVLGIECDDADSKGLRELVQHAMTLSQLDLQCVQGRTVGKPELGRGHGQQIFYLCERDCGGLLY